MTTFNPLAFDSEESLRKAILEDGLKRGWRPFLANPSEATHDAINNILTHVGVKGMRWGVRRAQKKAERGEKKFAERVTNPRKQINLRIELHNATGKAMNEKHIPRINNKPEYKKAIANHTLLDSNHPTTKKYMREFEDAYISELNKEAAKMTSPSGTRKYQVHRSTDDFLGFIVSATDVKQVKHAEEESFRVLFIRDNEGRIIGFEIADKDLAQSAIDDALAHVGVKGMRWGVRRDRSSKVTVIDKKKKIKTSGGVGRPASPDAIRARQIGQVGKKSGLKALSNEELRAFNERLNLEQNAKRLRYNDQSPPKKFVLKVLGQTGTQQANEAANAAASKQVKKLLVKAAVT